MDASFKITRREIGAAYDAGRDAVVALIEDLIEQFSVCSSARNSGLGHWSRSFKN